MLKHALPRSIRQSTLLFPPTRLRLADEPDDDAGYDDEDFDEEDEDEEDEEPEDEDEEEWQVGTRRHAN